MTALDAFLHNNYGYWYPYAVHWVIPVGVSDSVAIGDIHSEPIVKLPWVERIYKWYMDHEYHALPLGQLLTSSGFCFWIWLFCGTYCLYNNRRKFPLFMIGFFIWGPILFSAVYAEFRYVYGLFTCVPLVMASTLSVRGHQQVIGDAK